MYSDIEPIGSDFESFARTLDKLRINTLSAYDSHTSALALSKSQLENVKQVTNEPEESEPKDLPHKKGHPFYLIKPEDLVPKFRFLENFAYDDYCFFKPDVLEKKLIAKQWKEEATQLCITLIHETIGFCVDRKFSNRMGVATMEIMFQAFDFLTWNMYATLDVLHKFFRDMILLYAVDDIPASMMIFSPMECFIVAQYFALQYDSIFLLLKAVAARHYLVKINVEHDQN